tara:strand:+ start:1831 stop:2055 length:225 start_codon:yes stop_codon:yes gene_type:complete
MTDSFLHNHQAALDSQIEEKAIRDLQDAGIYPDPDNDDYDPTPYYLYDDSFGERPISPEERHRAAFEQKLKDKG